MARRRRFGRRRRRRTRPRKYRRGSRGGFRRARKMGNILRGPSKAVIPDFGFIKLIYENKHSFVTSGTIGIMSGYTYALNDIYDPDVSGTGTQPTGFDQYAQFYRKWCVYQSKITVTGFCATTGASIWFQITPDTSTAAGYGSDPLTMLRNAQAKTRNYTHIMSGRPTTSMSYFKKTKKVFGVKTLADDEYSGDFSNSPQNRAYWNMTYWSDFATITGYFYVRVKYYVRFYDRIEVLGLS